MISAALAVCLTLGSASLAIAADSNEVSEKAAAIGMLPFQKRGTELQAEERNPFAERVIVRNSVAAGNPNTEESKLRSRLSEMKVTGISRGEHGYTAQIGGMILKEGEMVDQLIPRQSDKLRVTKVTDKTVEISWVNEEGAEEPRKHVLELDLRPLVATKLAGNGGVEPIDPRGGPPVGSTEFLANGGSVESPED